jgi:hypothetical protein
LRIRPGRAKFGHVAVETTRAMRWSAPGWRNTVLQALLTVALIAAFPRSVRWLWWPAGAGRRGLAAYVVVTTLLGFWVRGFARDLQGEHEAAIAEARARLGREPTQREVHDQYARRMLRRSLGREPTGAELARALRPGAA